jgi:2-methylcitrate dehydratase
MLAGPDAVYDVVLPLPDGKPRAIHETYTKAHSAEYQAQAFIDLALDLRRQIDLNAVAEIVVRTSHHTHAVIGSGASDPQKYHPDASRETLDHSLPYILAVALEDGAWHHERSYAPERAHRSSTVALWRKVRTVEDPHWSARYRDLDPAKRAFGGHVTVTLNDGRTIEAELAVADAHPNGRRPWRLPDYEAKFRGLANGIVTPTEADRVITDARRLTSLTASDLRRLNPVALPGLVRPDRPTGEGILDGRS